MTNKSKVNYDSTKKLASDLAEVLGISKRLVVHFTRILSLGYITQVAGKALDTTEGKLKTADIDIPYVGRLTLEFGKDKITKSTIDIDSRFEKQLLNAVNTGETKLITELEKALIETIKEKYNSIL